MTVLPAAGHDGDRVAASYRELAEIYHDLLSHDDPDEVLARIVGTVRRLIPVAGVLVAEADAKGRSLRPVVAEGEPADAAVSSPLRLGEGPVGIAAERGRDLVSNDAGRDGGAVVSMPLVARGVVIGAMSLYREGAGAAFSDLDFELAQRFADVVTLALENARTRAGLRDLAVRDELTGILNRRGFNEQLASSLDAVPSTSTAALVFVDLDDFKLVNDEHGHLAGDEVLRAVAFRLEQAADGHPVFRLDGDEFAALVVGPAAETERDVTRIATRLERLVVHLAGVDVEQTASIGIAKAEGRLARPDTLLRQADQALSRAKRAHRSTRPLRLASRRRL